MTDSPTTPVEVVQDERGGMSSASGLDRVANCPGSPAAEKGLAPLPVDDIATEGTDIHSSIESGETDDLEFSAREVAEKLKAMEQREIANWLAFHNFTEVGKVVREERLWIRDRSTLELISSAKLDVYAVTGSAITGVFAIAIDFKSGYRTPTPSEKNWQLKCQVVALWQAHPEVEFIRAATAHSRLSSSFDATDYTIEDIKRAEREIRQVIWRSQQPDAPRVPGAHCRYCKALGVCREAATHSLVVAHGGKLLPTGKPDQLAIIEAVSHMTPGELAFVHKKEPLAKAFFDSVEARMKQLPPEELEKIGFKLADGNRLRNITDPATAFARLGDEFGLDRLAGLKLTVGRIADAHAERTGISKKEATEKIYAAMGDVVVEKEGNKRLKAI